MGFGVLTSVAPTIESGIPLPPPKGGTARKYPWVEMRIGDSFFIVSPQPPAARAAHQAGKRHGLKFTTRAVVENGVKGVRIWRIA